MSELDADPFSSGIALRAATVADAPAIGGVFDAAVRASWTYLGDIVRDPLFAPEDWRQLVADHASPNVLLVAIDATGSVVGYAAVHPFEGELFLLFVDPAHEGRGVGRALLAAAHDALRVAGCSQSFLYTHEQNQRALAVYAAAGYQADGSIRESDFRGVRLREPRLVKRL